LAQLSFNHEIAIDFFADEEIQVFLQKFIDEEALINDQDESEFNTLNICKKIKWNVNEAMLLKSTGDSGEASTASETHTPSALPSGSQLFKEKHVMISYNTGSRDTCLKMRNELEKRGCKVWMDVQDIHGSSLDSMAKAVEGSCCVLICITEKYRQSINCQSEAQYAYRLNKPIIPCVMQEGYENVTGWLGIIMGDKIYIDFAKREFAECMRRLIGEIEPFHKIIKQDMSMIVKRFSVDLSSVNMSLLNNASMGSRKVSIENAARFKRMETLVERHPETSSSSSIVMPKGNRRQSNQHQPQQHRDWDSAALKIKEWDERMFKQWFKTNDISMRIYEYMQPCSAESFEQMHQIKCTAPEFFHSSLLRMGHVDLKAIGRFSYHLSKLFPVKV
jgi:hypothetical protein